MNTGQLPITWFDITVIVVLFLGLRAGRKHGMSGEWLPCLQWVVMIPVATLAYKPLGDIIFKFVAPMQLGMGKSLCYILVYLSVMVFFKLVFSKIKSLMPERWTGGSDAFGKGEFYLGMMAGVFRYCCILCASLAILNAPYYSPSEVAASLAFQKQWYGSDFFPSFQSIQHAVLKESLVGKTVSNTAGVFLIASNQSPGKSHK